MVVMEHDDGSVLRWLTGKWSDLQSGMVSFFFHFTFFILWFQGHAGFER